MSRHPSKLRGGFKDYSCQAKLRGGFSDFFTPESVQKMIPNFTSACFFWKGVGKTNHRLCRSPFFLLSRLQHANPVLNAVNLRSNQISRKRNCWLETISLQEWWLNRGWQPLSHNSAMVLRRRFGHKKKCRHASAGPERVGGIPNKFRLFIRVFSDLGCSINFGCSFTCFQVLSFQINSGCFILFLFIALFLKPLGFFKNTWMGVFTNPALRYICSF